MCFLLEFIFVNVRWFFFMFSKISFGFSSWQKSLGKFLAIAPKMRYEIYLLQTGTNWIFHSFCIQSYTQFVRVILFILLKAVWQVSGGN